MFQQLHVKYFGDDRRTVRVQYILTKNQCVFTATTKIPSSINAAEEIIAEICRTEKRSPKTLRFFDLQTCQGYTSKKFGEFEVDELLFSVTEDNKVSVESWKPTSFLPGKRQLFNQFIGVI